MKKELNVERLLGAKVCDVDGERVGRIEEIRADRQESECLVESYLVGASAVVERLSAWTLIRPIKKLLRARDVVSVYRVNWQDMDLSDPEHPKLRIGKKELHRAR
jgi:sporulation protein YlmC with PRC-barrel domain